MGRNSSAEPWHTALDNAMAYLAAHQIPNTALKLLISAALAHIYILSLVLTCPHDSNEFGKIDSAFHIA
jgi:hypothetical protein